MKDEEFYQERQRLKEQIRAAQERHNQEHHSQERPELDQRDRVGESSRSDQRLRPRQRTAPDLGRVMDIPVRLSLEVGGAELSIRDILALQQGEVVELDREAGEALDVLVNGRLIARGEVVVMDDRLGVRLTEVLSPNERLQSMA